MHNEKIAAVDFGSKKLSISFGNMEKDSLDIVGYLNSASKGIEKGLIKDEEKCKEAFLDLITAFEKKIGEPVDEIYAGISTRNVRIKEALPEVLLREGKVRSKDINKAIEKGKTLIELNEGEEIIDFTINFYVLDENPIFNSIVGWMGQNLKVSVTYFIGDKKEVEKFKKVITSSGKIFKGYILNIYSGKQVFLNGKNSDGVKALVDVGAGISDYVIFKNGIVKEVGNIPLGGNNITYDLAICGEYSKGEAENIKVICSDNYETLYENRNEKDTITIGTSEVSKTFLYEVTRARLDEMLKLINAKLKKSSYYEDICSIILYGDGITYYENIEKMINDEFDKEVKGITNEYLGMKNSLNITSLAIVKEVSDRLYLLKEDTKSEKEIEYLLNEKKETEQPKFEEDNSIVRKIKKVLGDIF